VFVFEGGYAVAAVGVNAVNVLEGFVDFRPHPSLSNPPHNWSDIG
jgi:acetoin utilization deacetylase AcuC-like enzyme